MTLDSFVVLDLEGQPVSDAARMSEVRESLRAGLVNPATARESRQRMVRRQLRAFRIEPRVTASVDAVNGRTVLEVLTADRPGLLASIGWALADNGVRLQNAKISTFGERAEDVFFVTDSDNQPLGEAQLARVQTALGDAAAS